MVHSIRATLERLGPVQVIAPSSLETFADEVTRLEAASDLLVIAGGDGSMNLTVNALAGRLDDVVLALIPMGTGNDLAGTLEIPTDPGEAAERVLSGVEKAIDVGRATGPDVERLFVNACVGGFSVDMNEAIDDKLKKKLGPAAFWVGGAKAAAQLHRATVHLNDMEIPDCLAAGVGNGRTSGGGLPMWPTARIDDGLLDGCALPASNHLDAAKVGAKLKTGSHAELEGVETTRAPTIHIDADPVMEINVDGELVGLTTPATFEIVGKVRVRF